jgi:predicted ATP-dependent endonuclease of OLD family
MPAMHLESFVVRNFRRLKEVNVDLSDDTTIFVGPNNSGKTSATHVFRLFLGAGGRFAIHDFSGDCWRALDELQPDQDGGPVDLPVISLDLWFHVDEHNPHRVVDLLPDLDWCGTSVGVRLCFEPRDSRTVLKNYHEARAASKAAADGAYQPWPIGLHDYLSARLAAEYQIVVYKLDIAQFDDARLTAASNYRPTRIENGLKVVQSLIRVDFLDAQRHLADTDGRDRAEQLSKRMSRFYSRYLQKPEPNTQALGTLAGARTLLDAHYAEVFDETLKTLGKLGYPGLADPDLMIKTDLRAESLLREGAEVHYAVPDFAPYTLPERYNGLGFKNLIYMVVDLLDFDRAWTAQAEDRPPVHLIMIEEPESHLHAQLQQVLVRQMQKFIKQPAAGFNTQLVVTTHSSHVLYEAFENVRYFRRTGSAGRRPYTSVRNLSMFTAGGDGDALRFLVRYLKLTHCDLFFANAAILVEGNVERILLPRMIDESLQGCHISLIEVSGAYAHRFRPLIEFLGLTCLVITDLDSVSAIGRGACPTSEPGAVTSNPTLTTWLPRLKTVEDLLNCPAEQKEAIAQASVRVAYQTRQSVTWRGETLEVAGRTFEDAFALQNLTEHADMVDSLLGLKLGDRPDDCGLRGVVQDISETPRKLDKTRFALDVINHTAEKWDVPAYIAEGLEWLARQPEVHAASATTHLNEAA